MKHYCQSCGVEIGAAGCGQAGCPSNWMEPMWAPPVSRMDTPSLLDVNWERRYHELLKDNELQRQLVQELRVELHKKQHELETHTLAVLKKDVEELKRAAKLEYRWPGGR